MINEPRPPAYLERLRVMLGASQWLSALALTLALLFAPPGTGLRAAGVLVCGGLVMIVVQMAVSHLLRRTSLAQIQEHSALAHEADSQRRKVELLFAMTDMLQSAESHADAGQVLQATSTQLLPDLRGALYIFNHSLDRLDLASFWPQDGISDPVEVLAPGNCWALKRGKAHINDPANRTLCCQHNNGEYATLEVPMIARGTVHGLLMLASNAPDAADRLRATKRTAQALTDSMSLALANMALQDKLRTQSLRDPLTGLYNRRYMEDTLERYLNIAERNGSPTAVVMIDLDHFKRLNDVHGHAKGDAVLRDVAAQLVGALRPSDVVSRYGGEELTVILPGCGLADASRKAETLRARIESLSDLHGTPITASFGLAVVPETSSGMSDVVKMADAALYEAKKAGRNCVVSAGIRPPGRREQPAHTRLLVATIASG
jgi:diguanylate cyclase (GGDEF)-like protein